MSIKDNFKICDSCKGEGFVWVYSHGFWGEANNYERCCYTCSGKGYVMKRYYDTKVKKVLGLK